jgi:hypothetical protein
MRQAVRLAIFGTTCLLGIWCCGPTTEARAVVEPFGVWSSMKGDFIFIRRNGTYDFCNADSCGTGRYERLGATGAKLLGLDVLPEAQRLLYVSGWLDLRDVEPDVVIRDSGESDAECYGYPCFLLGAADQGNRTYILKITDY